MLEGLESRHLLAVTIAGTTDGHEVVGCPIPDAAPIQTAATASVMQAPLADTFKLHSRPTATKVIYLDFDGHTTSGTAWNGGDTLFTPAYDIDGNAAAFSNVELLNIQEIWARVVEDFSPFDVNVTTEAPGIEDLRQSGVGDERWGIRVAIGGSYSDWFGSSAGGVAYVGSFTWSTDTPCFVFSKNTANGNPKSTAEAVSHEVGHTLGLTHDGRTTPAEGYYYGHGSGATGWAPIMGVGYTRELVQWSKGEYANANNTEDDLTIITTRNGFGYRADDHGNSVATARVLPLIASGPAVAQGVVERSNDVDVFEVVTAGALKVAVAPAAISPNLDVLAEIWSAAGTVLFTSNPLDALGASFDLTVAAGRYYLAVRGTGKGDVAGTGYSNYGSLGQYTVSIEQPSFSITAADARKSEGNSGSTPFTFVVTRSGSTAAAASVDWLVRGTGSRPADPVDFVGGSYPRGSLSFAIGETTKSIVVPVQGDLFGEWDEQFTVELANPSVGSIQAGLAEGVIVNEDSTIPVVSVAATEAFKAEGNAGRTTFRFTITRLGWIAANATATWSVSGSGARPATRDDFATGAFPSGLVTFAPGETVKTVVIDVAGDTALEPDEGFTVTIGSPNGQLGTSFASGTIRDDDTPPGFVVSTAQSRKPEGDSGSTAFTFTVNRLLMNSTIAVVNWAVSGNGSRSASAEDFIGRVFPSGTVTFAPDETAKIITVNIAGDTIREEDESFAVSISSAFPGSRMLIPAAFGTIVNDEVPPVLAIAATDARRQEGNSGTATFGFTIHRARYTSIATDVTWSVVGATATPATPDDFVGNRFPSGTVRFAVGETRKTITVSVAGDTVGESDERFTVMIGSPGCTINVGSAVGTILNDDVRMVAALFAATMSESGASSPGKPRPRVA
jgi:hypothetical protein